MGKILCMGSVTMDMVMRVPRFAKPGETVKTDNFSTAPGGKGSNQAVAAARLGGDVKYFTLLGGDDNSRVLTRCMADSGVDMGEVLYRQELKAGVAMGQVGPGGENCWTFFPGSSLALTAEDVRAHQRVFEGCTLLLLTAEIALPAIYEAVSLAKARGMTVILDPSPVPGEGIPGKIMQQLDYIKPNETEAERITGIRIDSERAAEKALLALAAAGVGTPVISLGEKGCVARIRGAVRYFAPVEVPVVDATAAGDVFLGGLAYGLSKGFSEVEGITFAQHAAALCVSRAGAQTSIPTRQEVEASLNCC